MRLSRLGGDDSNNNVKDTLQLPGAEAIWQGPTTGMTGNTLQVPRTPKCDRNLLDNISFSYSTGRVPYFTEKDNHREITITHIGAADPTDTTLYRPITYSLPATPASTLAAAAASVFEFPTPSASTAFGGKAAKMARGLKNDEHAKNAPIKKPPRGKKNASMASVDAIQEDVKGKGKSKKAKEKKQKGTETKEKQKSCVIL